MTGPFSEERSRVRYVLIDGLKFEDQARGSRPNQGGEPAALTWQPAEGETETTDPGPDAAGPAAGGQRRRNREEPPDDRRRDARNAEDKSEPRNGTKPDRSTWPARILATSETGWRTETDETAS